MSFKELSYSDYVLYFLILGIPLTLLSGPFLPDLSVSIVAIVFLFKLRTQNLKKYFNNKFFYFFFTFYLFLVFSSLLSDNIIFSLKSSLFYFRFIIFSLAVWYIIDHSKNFLNIFTWFLALVFTIAIINGYYQFYHGANFFGFSTYHPDRLTLTFDNKLILGGYLSRIFPLLLALVIFTSKRKNHQILAVSLMYILIDTIIFLSGERTALYLMIVSTLFIILFVSYFKVIRIITFFLSIIVIISISVFFPNIKERNIDKTLEQFGTNSESERIIFFSKQHESQVITAFNMFKDSPIIGVGPNNYRNLCDKSDYFHNKYSCSTHPHNTYAQLLAETGIIGFLFLISSIIFLLKEFIYIKFYKYQKSLHDDYKLCLLLAILLTLWPFIPSLNFFNNWINIIYFLPLGFFLHIYHSK